MPNSLALWQDRKGNPSWLRVATLALLVWPVILAGIAASRSGLTGRPLNELIHRSGWWALVFLLLSLAITPLRASGRWGRLVDVRRMIGVAAAVYAGVHLLLYVLDQNGNVLKVAAEIVQRLYLTIGFVALLGLLALAVTSNDAMVKRLGGLNWRRLHQVAYGIGVLALIHFFQQTKADIAVPMAYAGLFLWLMGYRILARMRGQGALDALSLLLLTVVAALLTFAADAAWIWSLAGRPPLSNFLSLYGPTLLDTDLGVRPGWYVAGAGLAVVRLELVRARMRPAARPALSPRTAP